MKTKFTPVRRAVQALLSTFIAFCATQLSTAQAQGTGFTYQGRLNDGSNPASGVYDLQFTIHDSTNNPGVVVAGPLTNAATLITNGLFSVMLDFGTGVFTGPPRWLDIAVRTNGGGAFSPLTPRQLLAPSPYAVFANGASNVFGPLPASQLSGNIPSANLSGTYNGLVNFNNAADNFSGSFFGQFFGTSFNGGNFTGHFIGDGSGLANLNPASINGSVAFLNSNQTFTAQNVFLQGIGVGTTNPSPFYQLDILGSQANVRMTTTNNLYGATIELRNTLTNTYQEYLGAINFNNYSNTYPGQIGYFMYPGYPNYDSFAIRIGGADYSFQLLQDDTGQGTPGLINGRYNYTFSRAGCVITGGGSSNAPNFIDFNSSEAFIGSGLGNTIGPNANQAAVVSGYYNTNRSNAAFIGAGNNNLIDFNVDNGAVGAGVANAIQFGSGYSFIGSGDHNLIQTSSGFSVIGGGQQNVIQSNSFYATIGGGFHNAAAGFDSTVGGGSGNSIVAPNSYGTIAGGLGNTISNNTAGAFIGAGTRNTINPIVSDGVIGGGQSNSIGVNLNQPTIAGGFANTIRTGGDYSFIGGGGRNTNSGFISLITGGRNNNIGLAADHSVIGGGGDNRINGSQALPVYAVVAGGQSNVVQANVSYSVIGGGFGNTVQSNAQYATIPGGAGNATAGRYSFAAGNGAGALHDGTFVWADANGSTFSSSSSNQFLIRAAGGVGINKTNPASALDVNGTITASAFIGGGGSLSGLDASQITSGTLGDARLSANVALLNGNPQTFTGVNNFGSNIVLTNPNATIQFPATSGANVPMITMFAAGTGNANRMVIAHSLAFPTYGVQYDDSNDRFYFLGNGSNVMTVDLGNHLVGIGVPAPTFQLQLSLDSAAKPNGGSWANSSDARVKKKIQPMSGALEKLTRLRGVTFEWINPEDHANQTGAQAGFVAQDVEAVFPNWVKDAPGGEHDRALTPDGRVKSLSLPFEFDALVVESLRELRAGKDAQIAELKQQNELLEKRLEALERIVLNRASN